MAIAKVAGQIIEVACSWIGNTPAVAWKHYLQITDDDIEKANGADDGSSSRLSEEVAAHAPGRPHDSEAKARPTPIGMTHEKEAHRQQAR